MMTTTTNPIESITPINVPEGWRKDATPDTIWIDSKQHAWTSTSEDTKIKPDAVLIHDDSGTVCPIDTYEECQTLPYDFIVEEQHGLDAKPDFYALIIALTLKEDTVLPYEPEIIYEAAHYWIMLGPQETQYFEASLDVLFFLATNKIVQTVDVWIANMAANCLYRYDSECGSDAYFSIATSHAVWTTTSEFNHHKGAGFAFDAAKKLAEINDPRGPDALHTIATSKTIWKSCAEAAFKAAEELVNIGDPRGVDDLHAIATNEIIRNTSPFVACHAARRLCSIGDSRNPLFLHSYAEGDLDLMELDWFNEPHPLFQFLEDSPYSVGDLRAPNILHDIATSSVIWQQNPWAAFLACTALIAFFDPRGIDDLRALFKNFDHWDKHPTLFKRVCERILADDDFNGPMFLLDSAISNVFCYNSPKSALSIYKMASFENRFSLDINKRGLDVLWERSLGDTKKRALIEEIQDSFCTDSQKELLCYVRNKTIPVWHHDVRAAIDKALEQLS